MTTVTDRWGRSLTLYNVLTVCPAEYATEARQVAAEFIGESAESMLHDSLQKSGTLYVGCVRQAWGDELSRQSSFMYKLRNQYDWIDGVMREPSEGLSYMFAMYVAPSNAGEDMLATLGLETV